MTDEMVRPGGTLPGSDTVSATEGGRYERTERAQVAHPKCILFL